MHELNHSAEGNNEKLVDKPIEKPMDKPVERPRNNFGSMASKNKGKLALLVLVLVLLGVGIFGIKLYEKFLLGKAIAKTVALDSVTADIQSADGKLEVVTDLQKSEGKLSQVKVLLSGAAGLGKQAALTVMMNKKDAYVGLEGANFGEQFTGLVGEFSPVLLKSMTYSLVLPFVEGKKAIHVAIPESMNKPKDTTSEQDKKQLEKIKSNLVQALIVRRFEPITGVIGNNFHIIMGLDKNKLVAALEAVKDTNLDVKVSQLNFLIRVVKQTNNWNSDLIDVNVHKGLITDMNISVPEIPDEVLKDSAKELSSDPGLQGFVTGMTSRFKDITEPKSNPITKVVVLKLTNPNNAPVATAPTDIVEFTEIMKNAQVEVVPVLMPLFGQLLGAPAGSMGSPSYLPYTKQK